MRELQIFSSLALDRVAEIAEPERKVNGFALAAQRSLRSSSNTAIFATKALDDS